MLSILAQADPTTHTTMAEAVVFWILAPVALGSAIAMVFSRNAVHAALLLVLDFFCLAVFYAAQDAPFLAVVQVIVYAGAIMVLFLFVIMLLNLQHAVEPNTRPIQQFLGYTSGAAFGIAIIYFILKYSIFASGPAGPFGADARAIGIRMFEAYVFPFEMVSILLLAAIVGALTLTGRSAGTRSAFDNSGTEVGK
jgi:NADH-quinone oxidoreductase subunit J